MVSFIRLTGEANKQTFGHRQSPRSPKNSSRNAKLIVCFCPPKRFVMVVAAALSLRKAVWRLPVKLGETWDFFMETVIKECRKGIFLLLLQRRRLEAIPFVCLSFI